MKWISVKELPIPNGMIIVTDGNNIGYIDDNDGPRHESQFLEGYVSGIPDSNSFAMIGKDITHWFQIDDIPRPEDKE